jgi:hypothetical protein
MRVEAYTNIGLLRNHRCDSSRMAVACVGQHQFTGLKAEMSKPLGRTAALGSG